MSPVEFIAVGLVAFFGLVCTLTLAILLVASFADEREEDLIRQCRGERQRRVPPRAVRRSH